MKINNKKLIKFVFLKEDDFWKMDKKSIEKFSKLLKTPRKVEIIFANDIFSKRKIKQDMFVFSTNFDYNLKKQVII